MATSKIKEAPGRVFSGPGTNVVIQPRANTHLSSITLPAGTYVINGQFTGNKADNMLIMGWFMVGAYTIGMTRSTEPSGNGINITHIAELAETTVVQLMAYTTYTSEELTIANIRLTAIKIA